MLLHLHILCSTANGAAKANSQRVSTPRVKNGPEVRPVPSAPLTAVVNDAVRRWFQETHKEALRGDVVSVPTTMQEAVMAVVLDLMHPAVIC